MFKDALGTLGLGLALMGPGVFAPDVPYEDMQVGGGSSVAIGQRVTVHFQVADPTGAELANSQRRGLPYTFPLVEGSTDLFSRIVPGMKVGGKRRVRLGSADGFGAPGLPPIIPSNQSLVVVVTVLRVSEPEPSSHRSR